MPEGGNEVGMVAIQAALQTPQHVWWEVGPYVAEEIAKPLDRAQLQQLVCDACTSTRTWTLESARVGAS